MAQVDDNIYELSRLSWEIVDREASAKIVDFG